MINGDEIVFEFGGLMVERKNNGEFEVSNSKNNIHTKFMAIPKNVVNDCESYISVMNFSERHRVLKTHILKTELPLIIQGLVSENKIDSLNVLELEKEIEKIQKNIKKEKIRLRQLKKQFAMLKEKEQMEK